MSDQPIESSWTQVEKLTKIIQAAANSEDWSTVLNLSSSRHHMLQTHFEAHPVGPDSADFYRLHLGHMLRGENDLQQLVRAARKALMKEGISMQTSKRAVGAYLNASANL
ncbi:MAG TPA: hypothetical protein VGK97_02070 [Spongiibacteraceae bacterium]|jgi:hypothetical protein